MTLARRDLGPGPASAEADESDGSARDTNSWRGVRAELVRRINAGIWPPGTLLPNEADLALDFGCARATVNRAMRDLAEGGLLDRRRKAGTRVVEHPPSRVVLDIPVIRREVEARGGSWRQTLMRQEEGPAPGHITGPMHLAQGTRMLHVQSLHFADDSPFLFEDRWLNLIALPAAGRVDFAAVSANEWLLANVPYTTGRIGFSAVGADADLADLLWAAPGDALFVVDRLTWNGAQPITSVRLTYGPGYRMETAL